MTSEPERYELLVLGSGEAGKYLAWTMSRAGLRCAVVERKLIAPVRTPIACPARTRSGAPRSPISFTMPTGSVLPRRPVPST
jgi:choline dehydrogenase-like flavoprotein